METRAGAPAAPVGIKAKQEFEPLLTTRSRQEIPSPWPSTASAMLQRSKNGFGSNDHEIMRSSPDVTRRSGSSAGGRSRRARRSKSKISGRQRQHGPVRPYSAIILSVFCLWLLYFITRIREVKPKPNLVGPEALARLPREVGTFEFRGATRTAGKKPRIAIVTNAVAYPYGEKTTAQWSYFKEYFANKDCYARTHGYDLIVDSRNHVDGMGFYTNAETGQRGDTNVHFNKPYLLRKWLPHYDWVLWLDMDTLVVDIGRPIEQFIEEIGGEDGDIHVLVPQDQNVQFFFSACALLLRNSPETMEMVEDWFTLKDTCPYALYDDQSRLYAAILRMQLRWRGLEVDHSKRAQTDCLDVCMKKETQGAFSWCVDAAVRAMGIRRVPQLFPPVAYSRLPTTFFTKGNDTGLAFQGQFGGIKTHPHLVAYAFSVHTKPYCQKGGVQMCSPFVDTILAPNYQKGMQKCYGRGWLAKPYAALASLHYGAEAGVVADDEVVAIHVTNTSSPDALVPGMNVPYGIQFQGLRQGPKEVAGPGWRRLGIKTDKRFCFASLPGAAGSPFMTEVLGPVLHNRFCAHGDCEAVETGEAKWRAERQQIPCNINKVHQIFPYTLMADYPGNSKQPAWYLSMIRNPIDRVLNVFLSLKARLAAEDTWVGRDGVAAGDWSYTLNRWCGETRFVQYGGNPPPTLGPDMTLQEYVEIPGVDDIMTKFYFNRDWESSRQGGLCTGGARPLRYRPGGWEEFHHWQANGGVGALMEYQYFGVWELWKQSAELLRITLGAELADSADLVPPPESPTTLLEAGWNGLIEEGVRRLRYDEGVRRIIEKANKKDMMLYERAVMEFKRRCRYFGIPVPKDPYLLSVSRN